MTPNANRTAPAGHALNAAECIPRCVREGEHVVRAEGRNLPHTASKAQPDAGALAEPVRGEWLLADDDARFVYSLNDEGTNRWSFCVQGPGTPRGELEAVGRLARSAPDLLAALEDILRWVQTEADIPHRTSREFPQARLAIEAATGKFFPRYEADYVRGDA